MTIYNTPAGYEGELTWDDGTCSWAVYARPVAGHWWTKCGLVGHSATAPEELKEQGAALVKRHVELGLVR